MGMRKTRNNEYLSAIYFVFETQKLQIFSFSTIETRIRNGFSLNVFLNRVLSISKKIAKAKKKIYKNII